jgi:hypothetical protein
LSCPDLRALFRTNSRTLMSADVFANRDEEWAAVSRSLEAVVNARRDPTFDVEDVQAPRSNVLVFLGHLDDRDYERLQRERARPVTGEMDAD